MKFRSLLAAAMVLLVLGGLLWWSGHHKSTPKPNPDQPAIVKVNPAAVERFTLEPRGGQPIVVARTGPRQWQIQSPGTYLASSNTVGGMLSTVSDLRAVRVIEQTPANLQMYGLSEPEFQLQIGETAGKTATVIFGDRAPAGGGVYAMVPGDARVFLVPSHDLASVDKSVDELRDRRVLPVDADTVANFSLIRPGQTIHFIRANHGWQIEQPQPYRTDTFQVDDLLNQVVDALWVPTTDAAKAEAAFAHGKPVATVNLEGSTGKQSMEIREDDGNDYARSSAAPGTWQIDPAVGEAVSRSVDSFRNKQLFDFGYTTDPDKIEVHDGAKALFLTRTATTWWSAGTKMDYASVENLVSALHSLSAAKFVQAGFTAPTIRIIVTSNGGKQVETVELAPTKDGALARRTDGNSLYAIDSDMLGMLTSAIDGVKAAAPAKR